MLLHIRSVKSQWNIGHFFMSQPHLLMPVPQQVHQHMSWNSMEPHKLVKVDNRNMEWIFHKGMRQNIGCGWMLT